MFKMQIDVYVGGVAATNGYLISSEGGCLAIDAPEGFSDFIAERTDNLAALVLTHGHFDHIWDAAEIRDRFKCPVYYHEEDRMLCLNGSMQAARVFGLSVEIGAVEATKFLKEGDVFPHKPYAFQIFHVPGHCPGNICLYEENEKVVFTGDALFAGSIGRTDLPGGDAMTLLSGIKSKLLALPDETRVCSGHGPETTIGRERRTNPFLTEDMAGFL